MLKYPTIFYTRVILLQIMRDWGVGRAIPGWYFSKSWGRGVWWELYQDDISPNHEGEECGESYSRMIFLQIMRERGVVRAIPVCYFSKSLEREVSWERSYSNQVLYLSLQSVPNITEIRALTSTGGEVYSMQLFVNVISLTYYKSMDISGPTGILHQENW